MKTSIPVLLFAASAISAGAAALVQNPSFESNFNDAPPHYGPIDSWNGGSGVNEQGGPFHNTATAIPDRTRVAFAQGSTSLSQEIIGLTPGSQYWLQFWYDARNCCGGSIDITTLFGETELNRINNVRAPVLSSRPYYARSITFTPESEIGLLAFVTTATGDATALFDAITIVERDTNNVTVFNPSFEASGNLPAAGELTAMAGWEIAGIVGVDDGSAGMANNGTIPEQAMVAYLQGASSISQPLVNLIVGETYQVSVAYNAMSGTSPHIQVKAGEIVVFEEDVAPVGGTEAYRTRTASFVANDINMVLSIAQTRDGGDVLLLDNIRVLGRTAVPLPPLAIAPQADELGLGQRLVVTVTVPPELLELEEATLTFRSSNTNVMALDGADEEGVLALTFAQGGTNVQQLEVVGAGRGSARLEVVDAAGLTVGNDLAVNVVTSFVRNPSFESSPAPGGVGYGTIVAWTSPPDIGVGLNRAAGPFHDNGAIPDRDQVAFIQGSRPISQEVRGLTAGQKYWLQFYYNARNCCGGTIDLAVSFGETVLTNITQITPVGDVNSYYFANIEFTAAQSVGLLEFATTAQGDATVLLDAVNIVQAPPSRIVIRNPSFEASGSPANVGYVQPANIAGWEASGSGRGINVNGAGPFTDNGLASDQDLVAFLQGTGTLLSQLVSGFEPGQEYTLLFEVNARDCCVPGEASSYRVSLDDVPLVEEELFPVGPGMPFVAKNVLFTPAASEGVLKFEHTTPAGDHTLLLDNIRIVEGAFVEAPRLQLRRSDTTIDLAWPVSASAFVLESTTQLPGGWTPVPSAAVVNGTENVVTETIGDGRKYYRLAAP